MIELLEAVVRSDQIADTLNGREIREVTVLQSPHELTSFHGETHEYPERLRSKRISGAEPRAMDWPNLESTRDRIRSRIAAQVAS